MDDDLPFLFFSAENIQAAIKLERYDLVLGLLPCYLLLSSVLSQDLTKSPKTRTIKFWFFDCICLLQ